MSRTSVHSSSGPLSIKSNPLNLFVTSTVYVSVISHWLPWWLSGKESACQCRRHRFDTWVRKISWRRKWQPTPVFSRGKSHGQRSLAGYHSWVCKRARHDLATKQQQQFPWFTSVTWFYFIKYPLYLSKKIKLNKTKLLSSENKNAPHPQSSLSDSAKSLWMKTPHCLCFTHVCSAMNAPLHVGNSDHDYSTSVAAAAAKSLQSCPTLCNPIDGSPPGSAVPGILQARTLEWVAISFSNAWKWKVKVKSLSRVRLLPTPWTAAYQAPPSMGFSWQEYWSGVPLPSPYLC